MKTVGKTKSWNNKAKKDCFGLSGVTNIDHIWPISDGGSNIKQNRQTITKQANEAKGDDTSGAINGIKFAVHKKTTKKDPSGIQHIFGVMYIKDANSSKDEWLEVVPV